MMKSIVSMIAVLATALLLTGPTQAGYADGMNQYAGYHVMHGGVDPSGLIAFQSVGNGPQTNSFGLDGNFAVGYAGASVHASKNELEAARAAGGAALVYQRDSSWSIEDCDGGFSGEGEATTWHYDGISFDGQGDLDVGDAFGGDGGPVPLADGSTAIGYISLLQADSNSLSKRVIRQIARELIESGGDRQAAIRKLRELEKVTCTKGEISVDIDAKYFVGDQSWAGDGFEHQPTRPTAQAVHQNVPPGANIAGAEFVHKPWTTIMPRIWTYGAYGSASLSLIIKWDACNEEAGLQFSVEGDSRSLPSGPQRPGRNPSQGATIWTPDGDGGWTPNAP